MKFELTKSQIDKLEDWQQFIKEEFGSYGEFEYRFTPTGIGCYVEVYSKILNRTLNLTEVENW